MTTKLELVTLIFFNRSRVWFCQKFSINMLAATGPLLKSRNGRISSELLNNSYPKKFIDRVKTRIANQALLARNWTSTICIPYVPKISEAIRRTLNLEGIRVAFASTNTLGKSLTHVPIPKDKASILVYKLSCQDCTTVYIGETSRSVDDGMKEHSLLVKRHS